MTPVAKRRSSRKRSAIRFCLILAVLAAVFPAAKPTGAQAVRVGRFRPAPQLFVFLSLTVTASPSTTTFALVHGGAATASSAVAITTNYFGGASLAGTLTLYAYFTSAANALTGGTPSSSIPSSAVFGLVPTGTPTTYTAFTQTTPYSGASGLQIYTLSSLVSVSGSRTDNLNLKIDLSSLPQLPAATYSGTITLEAQSF